MEGKRRGGRSDGREVVELVEKRKEKKTVRKEEWTQRFLGIVCLSLSLLRKCSLVYSGSSIALVAEYYGFSLVIGIRKCGIEFAIRSESRDVQLVEQLVVYSSSADALLGVARGSPSSSSLCPFARLFSRCSSAGGGGHSACLIDRPRRRCGGSRDRPSIFSFERLNKERGDLFTEITTRGHADFPPSASPLISPVFERREPRREPRSNNETISLPLGDPSTFSKTIEENRNTGAD